MNPRESAGGTGPAEAAWPALPGAPELPSLPGLGPLPEPKPASDAPVDRAWAALHAVPDPEVPAVSVVDLGIVREIVERPEGGLRVVLTPTYSGCPATEAIEGAVAHSLEAAGLGPVEVSTRRQPAWTTDWISAAGRERLRAYGIAPPGPVPAGSPVRIHLVGRRDRLAPVACPRCDSSHTERLSAFGATACKALYRCLDCREPFEHFKPL